MTGSDSSDRNRGRREGSDRDHLQRSLSLLERLRKGELTLLVERGGRLGLASDRPGLKPLFRAVKDHPEIFEGAEVACVSVGLATAYLFVHAKAASVATLTVSKEAEKALEEAGIELAAEQKIKQLKEERGPHELDFDQIARDAGTVGRFVDELRQRLA